MKNVTILAIIGTNRVFYTDGCPFHINDTRYNDYCRTLTFGHRIIITGKIFEVLSNVSPPFPCSEVFIVSDKTYTIDGTNTTAVDSLDILLSIPDDSPRHTFIVIDTVLYNDFRAIYAEEGNRLLVITLDRICHGTNTFGPPSPLEWRPLHAKKQYFPGFIVEHYQYDHISF